MRAVSAFHRVGKVICAYRIRVIIRQISSGPNHETCRCEQLGPSFIPRLPLPWGEVRRYGPCRRLKSAPRFHVKLCSSFVHGDTGVSVIGISWSPDLGRLALRVGLGTAGELGGPRALEGISCKSVFSDVSVSPDYFQCGYQTRIRSITLRGQHS